MKKLRGYVRDENNYILGDYRIWYEMVGDILWVYWKDNDEFETILNMPSYWWLFLREGQVPNIETQLKFEKYLIERLGL